MLTEHRNNEIYLTNKQKKIFKKCLFMQASIYGENGSKENALKYIRRSQMKSIYYYFRWSTVGRIASLQQHRYVAIAQNSKLNLSIISVFLEYTPIAFYSLTKTCATHDTQPVN